MVKSGKKSYSRRGKIIYGSEKISDFILEIDNPLRSTNSWWRP